MHFIVNRADRNSGSRSCRHSMAANATRIAANPTEMITIGVIGKISPMAVRASARTDWHAAPRCGDGQQCPGLCVVT